MMECMTCDGMSTDLVFKHIDLLPVAVPVAHVVALWPDPFEVALLQLADDLQLVGRCRLAVEKEVE